LVSPAEMMRMLRDSSATAARVSTESMLSLSRLIPGWSSSLSEYFSPQW
jgi:hypothetical protein